MKSTIILAGGGTGGHFYPLLGFAHFYHRYQPKMQFFYVGSIYGMEKHWIHQLPFDSLLLPIQGIQRSLSWKALIHNLKIPFLTLSSFISAWKVFKKLSISMVVATGGYGAFIPLFYARIKNIPYILIEGNAVPGLVNRLFAHKACSILCYFPLPNLKEKQRLTPFLLKYARSDLKKSTLSISIPPRELYPWRILIMGGSLGAKSINQIAENLIQKFQQIFWIWQTGKRYYSNYLDKKYPNALILPYIESLDQLYPQVDVVISRAGASTLVELLFYRKPAILIPSPNVVNLHQHENAKFFESIGGGKWFEETEVINIIQYVNHLIENPEQIQRMKRALEKVAVQFDEAYEKEIFQMIKQCEKSTGISSE